MTYEEQLQDPRWHTLREQAKIRDNFQCCICGDANNLEVHHIRYFGGLMAWEYPLWNLKTLCHGCHRKVEEQRPGLPAWKWIYAKQGGRIPNG